MIASAFYRWSNHVCRYVHGAALGIGALIAGTAPAHADVLDTVQVHGFLSQALIVSRHNDFFGPSSQDGGSLQYTEVGVNASMRPTNNLLVSAQVLSRRAGDDNSHYEPKLDYGLLDYQFITGNKRVAGVQIGKLKQPFGIYNQTRDVAFTRPSILLPQSIYFDRTRAPALSSEGISVYEEEHLHSGILHFQAGVGKANTDRNVKETIWGSRVPASIDGALSSIGQVAYEHGSGGIVAALTVAEANIDIDGPPGAPDRYSFQPIIMSLQYNHGYWSITGEYALRRQSFEGGASDQSITGESWYLQYSQRFLEDWQWLLRYDSLVNDRADPKGKKFESDGRGVDHSQFAKDWTLGLQWNATSDLLLSTEYHHVDGTGWLPRNQDESDRYWDMLLFQASWRF
ncbi:hypothetical protein [Kushneria phyllosphaerae]|uniref:Porin domain-containing protein n=1 Tax=Kushneria phyllosphaerae TaxID=2100822 RepID=A0A2R8CI48_9GAMM|nr:hypothetical protein [Kushneria phyllosphaerae]SPJ32569.1 hypothetical protein KSP9073_00570 [Kushneria phyllosphaerae]